MLKWSVLLSILIHLICSRTTHFMSTHPVSCLLSYYLASLYLTNVVRSWPVVFSTRNAACSRWKRPNAIAENIVQGSTMKFSSPMKLVDSVVDVCFKLLVFLWFDDVNKMFLGDLTRKIIALQPFYVHEWASIVSGLTSWYDQAVWKILLLILWPMARWYLQN